MIQVCTACKEPFDGTRTAYLKYNDVFNNEDTYHVGCWNKSVFGEDARAR